MIQGKKDGVDKLAQAFVTEHPHLSKAEVRRRILEIAERKRHVEGHGTARWVCKKSYVVTLDSAASASLSEPVKFTPKKAAVKPKVEKIKQQSGPSSSTEVATSVTTGAAIDVSYDNNNDADKDAPSFPSETSPSETAADDDEGEAEADVSADDDQSENAVSSIFLMNVDEEDAPAMDEQPDDEHTGVDTPSPSPPTSPVPARPVDDSALVTSTIPAPDASSTPTTDATDLAASTTTSHTQVDPSIDEVVKADEEQEEVGQSEAMIVVE